MRVLDRSSLHGDRYERRKTRDDQLARYRQTKALRPGSQAGRTSYARKYGPDDVALLAELDRLHDTLSGPATKALLIRPHQRFGDAR